MNDIVSLRGYRTWKIVEIDGSICLASAYYRRPWPRGAPLVARHASLHKPPEEECRCGIYYASTKRVRPLFSRGSVLGEVEVWGKVIQHTNGGRAEYAYPASLLRFYCYFCGKKVLEPNMFAADTVLSEPGDGRINLIDAEIIVPVCDVCLNKADSDRWFRRTKYNFEELISRLKDGYGVEFRPEEKAARPEKGYRLA